MKCPQCGGNIFQMSIQLAIVVDTDFDTAYIDDIEDYRGAICVRCGEWELNEGDIFEPVRKLVFDYDKIREVLNKAKMAKWEQPFRRNG